MTQRERVLWDALSRIYALQCGGGTVCDNYASGIAVAALSAADTIPDAPSKVEAPDSPEWDSVRRNAAETDSWPQWKRDGSGLQMGSRKDAIPDAPVAACKLCEAGFPGSAPEDNFHYGTQRLGMIPNTPCLAKTKPVPSRAELICHVCGRDDIEDIGDHVRSHLDVRKCELAMTDERRTELIELMWREYVKFTKNDTLEASMARALDALIKAGAVKL